ncbi:MAG: hypothetical protein ACXWPI_16285 [Ktedonobacterales bacterium]
MSDVEARLVAQCERWHMAWLASGNGTYALHTREQQDNQARYYHMGRLYHRQLEQRWQHEDSESETVGHECQ